jgi:hypothetical protein
MTRVVVDTDVVSFLFKNHPIAAGYEADLADHHGASGYGCISNSS